MGLFLRGGHEKVGAPEALPKGRGNRVGVGVSLLSLLGKNYTVRRKRLRVFANFPRGILFLVDGEQGGFPFRTAGDASGVR